jgi:nitrous oxidase accessory protein NosD
MRRTLLATGAVVTGLAGGASPALAARPCAGHGSRCQATLQAALDAARDGDTIRLGPGTFAGGVTIDRSVTLIGAGAGRTVIRGGGPVITVGVLDAPSEPTVTIRDVTITGGVTHSSGHCGPICGANYVQATALGGGIEVPPVAGSATGATVTIRSVRHRPGRAR